MNSAARGHAAFEGGGNLLGEAAHHFMYPCRSSSSATFYRQKGFGHGDGNFAGIEGNHRSVAFDDAQLAGRCGRERRAAAVNILLHVACTGGGFNVSLHRRLPREVFPGWNDWLVKKLW